MSQIQRIHELLNQARPYAGVISKMIHCTPEFAKFLLELNTHNRKLSVDVVAKYVQEILDGEWMACPAGIGISEQGVLIDGQHRLQAIVESGKTVPLLVSLGLPVKSQEKVDRHRRRDLFAALVLAGVETHRMAVQISAFMVKLHHKTGVPSDSQVRAYLEMHHVAMQRVIKAAYKQTVGIKAALAEACEVYPDEADAFMEKLREPTEIARDDPRYCLHKWISEGGGSALRPDKKAHSAGFMRQKNEYRAALFCINAFVAGRKILAVRQDEKLVMPQTANV